jgi:hypothetical protein
MIVAMNKSAMTAEPYSTPQDVARAALRLLSMSDYIHPIDLELSAAILAVQICDWHAIRLLNQSDVSSQLKADFGAEYPNWQILRSIANGTKHPTTKHPNISVGQLRDAEWEDDDYWNAPVERGTLFIDIGGKLRSVHSLTFGFCHEYLERNP